MKFGDLKYLSAYILPFSAFYAIGAEGIQSFITLIIAFILLPIIEGIVPPNDQNLSLQESGRKETQRFFDVLLFINIPIVYCLIVYFFQSSQSFTSSSQWVSGIATMALILSTSGINVAHELGHNKSSLDKTASKILLLPSLYMHFIIEHNIGHHMRVSTPEDPASSRKNENLYSFWFRSITKSYTHALTLEKKRLSKSEHGFYSIHNQMFQFIFIQLAYLFIIFFFFGMIGLYAAIAMAIGSFLILETINYVEHYGLVRQKLSNGKYERVTKRHSWNSNHILGRIFLYELTRHSDHHYKASKKYQVLDHHDESPQLPLGYPGSLLLALIPPLWFRKMNPLVEKYSS